MSKVVQFLYRHEVKLLLLPILVYFIGMGFLPDDRSIEDVWVKSWDIVIGTKEINNAYWYIITGPCIIFGGVMGILTGAKSNYDFFSSIGVWWCFLSIIYGLLTTLYSMEYLYSSICLFLVGVLIILMVYIDKNGKEYENNKRSRI